MDEPIYFHSKFVSVFRIVRTLNKENVPYLLVIPYRIGNKQLK